MTDTSSTRASSAYSFSSDLFAQPSASRSSLRLDSAAVPDLFAEVFAQMSRVTQPAESDAATLAPSASSSAAEPTPTGTEASDDEPVEASQEKEEVEIDPAVLATSVTPELAAAQPHQTIESDTAIVKQEDVEAVAFSDEASHPASDAVETTTPAQNADTATLTGPETLATTADQQAVVALERNSPAKSKKSRSDVDPENTGVEDASLTKPQSANADESTQRTADTTVTGPADASNNQGFADPGQGDNSRSGDRSRRSARDRREHVDQDPKRSSAAEAFEQPRQDQAQPINAEHRSVASQLDQTAIQPGGESPQFEVPREAPLPKATNATASVTGVTPASETRVAPTPVARSSGEGIARAVTDATLPANQSNAAAKTSKSDASSASDAVTRAKLVQRVSKAFNHLGPDGGTVRLKLAPVELGSVRVEMQIQGKKVTAKVVAETEAAANALRENLAELRGRLESQGMNIEKLEVQTESEAFRHFQQSGGQSSQDYREDHADLRESFNRVGSTRTKAIMEVSQTISLKTDPLTSRGVDIRI